ncbi:hypothetical protein M9H77_07185 [Catharanthus roseus]|uniref:Uncharacterized protein n=1 Tax=Catharanthus roseus TaxID=4058 RepID=A0ACC0BU73_CATRO|nr:hypothetical protein M9H77_07185 [Catharanthus roseus]
MCNLRATTDGWPHPTFGDYSQGCLELKKEEQSRATDWGYLWHGDCVFVLPPLEPLLNCTSNWLFQKTGRDTIHILTSTSRSGGLSRTFLGETIVNIQHTMMLQRCTYHSYDLNLGDLLSKYIDSVNAGVKRMEAVIRSQTASFQNMENYIELIAKGIVEELVSHITSNTVTLQDVEEQAMTFPMFMDDDGETTQESEEFTFPGKRSFNKE